MNWGKWWGSWFTLNLLQHRKKQKKQKLQSTSNHGLIPCIIIVHLIHSQRALIRKMTFRIILPQVRWFMWKILYFVSWLIFWSWRLSQVFAGLGLCWKFCRKQLRLAASRTEMMNRRMGSLYTLLVVARLSAFFYVTDLNPLIHHLPPTPQQHSGTYPVITVVPKCTLNFN